MTFVMRKGPNCLGCNLAVGCDNRRFVPSSHTCCPSVKGQKWHSPFFRSTYFCVIACARLMAVWARSRSIFRWAIRCSISGMFVVCWLSLMRGVNPMRRSNGVCLVVVLGHELCGRIGQSVAIWPSCLVGSCRRF
jgi:hypothetical protein